MDALVGRRLLTETLPFTARRSGSDKALVIVETRPLFFLPYVVASAIRTHPDWHLYVFGTPDVHTLLGAQCTNYHDVTAVTLSGRLDQNGYSKLLMSSRFWSLMNEEHVLVFQADCVLVRPTPTKFLEFDYIGPVCGTTDPAQFIMNGGLSLRRRSAMLRAVRGLARGHPSLLEKPEDVAFCEAMRSSTVHAYKLPTLDECNEFAIESIGDPDTAIGMHGTDKQYAPPELIARLLGLQGFAP